MTGRLWHVRKPFHTILSCQKNMPLEMPLKHLHRTGFFRIVPLSLPLSVCCLGPGAWCQSRQETSTAVVLCGLFKWKLGSPITCFVFILAVGREFSHFKAPPSPNRSGSPTASWLLPSFSLAGGSGAFALDRTLHGYSRGRPAEGTAERGTVCDTSLTFAFNPMSRWSFRDTEQGKIMLYLINYKDNACVYDLLSCKYERKLKTEDFSTFLLYFHRVKPSFLEYLSYLLNFMSVIAGPCNNYKDYVAFIEGRHIHMKLLEVNWKQTVFHSLPEPSPTVSFSCQLLTRRSSR